MFSFLHGKSFGSPLFPILEVPTLDNPVFSSYNVPSPSPTQGEPTVSSEATSVPGSSSPLPPTTQPPPISPQVSQEVSSQRTLSPQPALRKSTRNKHPPAWMHDFVTSKLSNSNSYTCSYPLSSHLTYSHLLPTYQHALSVYSSIPEPSSFQQAFKDPAWVQAMQQEIAPLEDNHTWSIVDLPAGKTPIGCKWIYKVNYKASGEVKRYKARLVAKGYSQKAGLDYSKTFSPFAKMVTVRSLVALAASQQ